MRCTHCGAVIPDDMLTCPKCGLQVQIVPDYNPLEDVLTREVKGSIEDATRQLNSDDVRIYRKETSRRSGTSTRVLSEDELEEIRARRNGQPVRRADSGSNPRRNTGSVRGTGSARNVGSSRNTGAVRTTGSMRSTSSIYHGNSREREAEERRRQQLARKKKLAKKRRRRTLIILFLIAAAVVTAGILYYQNSYSGQIRKGNQALSSSDYVLAQKYFNRAIHLHTNRADGYTGLSKVYIQQKDLDAAEQVFLTAIEDQPSNVALYQAAVSFYVNTDQQVKISELLEDCEDDNVLLGVKSYVSEQPDFSLSEGSYSEVQQVSVTAGDGTIYYTTDGSEPDKSSEKYTKPILLGEGENTIKAVSYNKKGIPSLTVSKTYTIELPLEDAPAVTPSTGQYDAANMITINVPEGYTAYYTTDGTDPTAASTRYTEPIAMPEGQTMFAAVLVNNQNNRMTQVTKRNYVLETN